MPHDVASSIPEFLKSWNPEILNSWIPEFLKSWIPVALMTIRNSWVVMKRPGIPEWLFRHSLLSPHPRVTSPPELLPDLENMQNRGSAARKRCVIYSFFIWVATHSLRPAAAIPLGSDDSLNAGPPSKRAKLMDTSLDETSTAEMNRCKCLLWVWTESDANFGIRMNKQADDATREGEKWLEAKVRDRETHWQGIEYGYAVSPEDRLRNYRSTCFFFATFRLN